jgi:F-type H+-transporting ATPase subunit b
VRGRVTTVALAAAIALSQAASALAEEGGQAHAHASPVWPLLYAAINLALFVWLLARFAWPSVRTLVRERRDNVVRAIDAATAAKAEALKLKTEWEARLGQFDQSAEEMRQQAQRDAERERDRILAAARKTADTIRRDAELAAAYELRRTQEMLRSELVRQAVLLAEESARSRLTGDDQQRFITEFLKRVTQ